MYEKTSNWKQTVETIKKKFERYYFNDALTRSGPHSVNLGGLMEVTLLL